jgi:hypothetical protein
VRYFGMSQTLKKASSPFNRQSKFMSIVEASSNVLIGYIIATAATYVILPLHGYQITTQKALSISLAFTAISLARSYILRRLFNRF